MIRVVGVDPPNSCFVDYNNLVSKNALFRLYLRYAACCPINSCGVFNICQSES
jgi:hypothetical protein